MFRQLKKKEKSLLDETKSHHSACKIPWNYQYFKCFTSICTYANEHLNISVLLFVLLYFFSIWPNSVLLRSYALG